MLTRECLCTNLRGLRGGAGSREEGEGEVHQVRACVRMEVKKDDEQPKKRKKGGCVHITLYLGLQDVGSSFVCRSTNQQELGAGRACETGHLLFAPPPLPCHLQALP